MPSNVAMANKRPDTQCASETRNIAACKLTSSQAFSQRHLTEPCYTTFLTLKGSVKVQPGDAAQASAGANNWTGYSSTRILFIIILMSTAGSRLMICPLLRQKIPFYPCALLEFVIPPNFLFDLFLVFTSLSVRPAIFLSNNT